MTTNRYDHYSKITLKCADDAKLRTFWAKEVYKILINKLKYYYIKSAYLTVHNNYDDYKVFRGPNGDCLFIDRDLFIIWFDELKAPSLYRELSFAAAKNEAWRDINLFIERAPEVREQVIGDHVRLKYLGF